MLRCSTGGRERERIIIVLNLLGDHVKPYVFQYLLTPGGLAENAVAVVVYVVGIHDHTGQAFFATVDQSHVLLTPGPFHSVIMLLIKAQQ